MTKPRLLIIDDELSFIHKMRFAFSDYQFSEALTIEQARAALKKNNFDLILLDLKLDPSSNKLDGLELIQPVKSAYPDTPLVVITADEKTETVVDAMKKGADDFLRKSGFDMLVWKKKFNDLIKISHLNQEIRNLQAEKYPFIGSSPEINEIRKTLTLLAENPLITVLITGETGVGKEVAGRLLHQLGKRRHKAFVAVNLSVIQESLLESALFGHKKGAFTGANYDREGYFRKANGGILFLDEIGDINCDIQVKLLRLLETKTIQVVGDENDIQLDVQIIVATNQNLKSLVDDGEFRTDLYYRIRNFQIDIPPLRHRKEDIEEILYFYLKRSGYSHPEKVLTEDVKEKLIAYYWPGNVRELKNTVDTMLLKMKVLHKSKIDLDCLPEDIVQTQKNIAYQEELKYKEIRYDFQSQSTTNELSTIEKALNETYGQKQAAAELLGMNADQLRYRVLKHWKSSTNHVIQFPSIVKYYKLSR